MHPYDFWLRNMEAAAYRAQAVERAKIEPMAHDIAHKALDIIKKELSVYRNKRKVRFIHMKKRVRNERRHERAAMAGIDPCPLVDAYDRTIPVDPDGIADHQGDTDALYYEQDQQG